MIVPVFEQWHLVPALLDRLQAQADAPGGFEVILVDNGSSAFDPPADVPAFARVVRHLEPGSYSARNFGVGLSQGEFLLFTDADCRPAPDWIAAMAVAAAERPGTKLFAGPVDVASEAERPNAWEIFDAVRGIPQADYVRRGYAATANLMVERALFARLGGFDATRFSGGDAEFCRRAGRAGHPVAFIAAARVEHPARRSWSEIATKARRLKGGQIRAGSRRERALWLARSFLPPVRGIRRLLGASPHPLRRRLVASAVLLRVWGSEMAETLRLIAGRPPERR